MAVVYCVTMFLTFFVTFARAETLIHCVFRILLEVSKIATHL